MILTICSMVVGKWRGTYHLLVCSYPFQVGCSWLFAGMKQAVQRQEAKLEPLSAVSLAALRQVQGPHWWAWLS